MKNKSSKNRNGKEKQYKCLKCGEKISKEEYFDNKGLCDECFMEEYPEYFIEEF